MRIVVFADWDHWVPRLLVETLLSTLSTYPTLHVVAVCVPRSSVHWQRVLAHELRRLTGWAKRVCMGDSRYLHQEPNPLNLNALARRHGFEVLVVPDANSAETAQLFRERLRPEALLSLFWKRKFGASFLALFKQAVNYHNGSVPDYRGLLATPWSVYRGEIQSGFTFHRINEGLDLGNVLIEGAISIEPNASVFDIERAKTRLAALRLPAVLDAMLANDPGVPQREARKYNRVRDIASLKKIEEPTSLSAAELLRRVRAFGPVQVRIADEFVWISGLGAPIADNDRRGLPRLQLEGGAWHVKTSDWRAHELKRIKRSIIPGRSTIVRS